MRKTTLLFGACAALLAMSALGCGRNNTENNTDNNTTSQQDMSTSTEDMGETTPPEDMNMGADMGAMGVIRL